MSGFKQLSDDLKPRERFRDAATPQEVSAEELLAILLRTGTKACDVLTLARRLLDAFSSVSDLTHCSDWRTLRERMRTYNRKNPEHPIRGIGLCKLLTLSAAFELSRRGFSTPEGFSRPRRIQKSIDAYSFFQQTCLLGMTEERFFVLPMDGDGRPLCPKPIEVAKGMSGSVCMEVRSVFQTAIQWGARAIVVAHNHPGGGLMPSPEDIALTKSLIAGAHLLGLDLLDHLIIDSKRYCSIRNLNVIDF